MESMSGVRIRQQAVKLRVANAQDAMPPKARRREDDRPRRDDERGPRREEDRGARRNPFAPAQSKQMAGKPKRRYG